MERRYFLKYASLATAGLAFAGCNQIGNFMSDRFSKDSEIDFGKLEKTDLLLGFVPTLDCAPLVIAKERGFFERYGLKVSLSKQADWTGIQSGLLEYRFDASQALFGMPMLAQLGEDYAPMVSLMMLNLNGSSIILDQKAWKAGIRPSTEYINFWEFADAYRKYVRDVNEPPTLAIEFPTSTDTYSSRYWLAAMGIDPDQEIELIETPPSQMIYKIQAGIVNGYCVGEPWNQQAVLEPVGFTAYVNRDIWKGHPGKVLAAMQPWVENYPTTARALVAAVLEACQFCDQPENATDIAQILAQSQHLNTNAESIEASLLGNYIYGGFEEPGQVQAIPDLNIFHFKETDYLKQPDHANYPWRSHGVWLLTQMIRWNQIDQQEYPKDADKIIDRTYPMEIYEDVAKALKIKLPSDQMKVEPASVFLDQREFDPSEPVAYLNTFDLRANRPQLFTVR